MRILLWHGWVLDGAGSNIYTARVAEVFRREGHDVLLLCQEPHPDRFPFIDGWGTVGFEGVGDVTEAPAATEAQGKVILLRPEIGRLLPVFVYDEYEGFDVKRFVDLSDTELESYLWRNAEALAMAVGWHDPEVVIMGHAIPGPAVARRTLGPGRYVGKIHGSDIEYAVRLQERYRDLAIEGLQGAHAIVGPSDDVLHRTAALVPGVAEKFRVVSPGVDVDAFQPLERREALLDVAARLGANARTERGRPSDLDVEVRAAVARGDSEELDALAGSYDQNVPDPAAAERLRELASYDGAIVGYIGKFIPQKGVHRLLAAAALVELDCRILLVGFGLFREWLAALALELQRGDTEAIAWLDREGDLGLEELTPAGGGTGYPPVAFTGLLDHRYAPAALAAMDVVVVPSILEESFGMVAAEAAATGALPLVARHSGLAEIAAALEAHVERPGFFSYEPGPGSVSRIAEGLKRLLELSPDERAELRAAVSWFVRHEWTWERTAERLLDAAAAR